ncbi:TPA: hypothetical protein NJV01_003361 [Escherichia coli]|nr:hypothetical protein [Escherichia coli]HCG2937284.1 hypothetical protein [Escherichia coli]HCG3100392.1 hypothetical protein [Escherichia coli]
MKYAALFFLVISSSIAAKMIPNTEMLNLYSEQRQQTRELMSELNEVMKITEPVFGLYKSLGGLTPEVVAVSKHLLQIQESADELYGKAPTITPFSSCRTLAGIAHTYWLEKLSSAKSKNNQPLNSLFAQYNNLVKECSKQIKTAPPKMVEELQIIDVAP